MGMLGVRTIAQKSPGLCKGLGFRVKGLEFKA